MIRSISRDLRDHRTVMAAEAAGVHSEWLDEFPDDYPPRIRDLILEGRDRLSGVFDYSAAGRGIEPEPRRRCHRCDLQAEKLEALDHAGDVSTAPDPSTTGDPAFNSPWSYTGLPTVSFPIGLAPDGLPVAIQLIGWCLARCTSC